jgi:carbon monoxide dehydrogenase subunit G
LKISASFVLSPPRERVFAALVDPEVLRRTIPGCEELTAAGEDVFAARLKIGVAGLKGSYSGKAELRDKHPPEAFTLTFDGKGGPGFVRGVAAIRLSTEPAGTRVTCDADVQVGGLIAAVGSRLVEATARKLAGDFFRQLALEIDAPAPSTF